MTAAAFGLKPDFELVEVATRATWRTWLAAHHEQTTGVWVVTVKKAAVTAPGDYVSAQDICEECLCFGWIDSKPGKVDDRRTALLCTPRKPGSGWSKVNKDRLTRLLAESQVAPPGLATIEGAKTDGSWTKLDNVDALAVPNDLAIALGSRSTARANFDAFPPSAHRGILEWILQAKTATTRSKRIDETARLAEQNLRANQWPRS